MSEPVKAPKRRRRTQFKANLQRLRSSRNQGMFGVSEILALSVSVFLLLIVVISYVYFLVPARSRREALEQERSRLQNQHRNSQEIIRKGTDTAGTVTKIVESLDAFQTYHLNNASEGRMGLYGELNQLIRKNGLRNTSGPAYTPLASSTAKQTPGETKSANTKWQSVYPGIAVSLTVEGQYQNLRRFVRDLEASKQFIIVNAIELERATETNTAASVDPNSSSARNSLVSLRLDMSTYFQQGANGAAQ